MSDTKTLSEKEPTFLFVACKFEYENQCKNELLQNCPYLRFSFSRPGFLTFKVEDGSAIDFSVVNRLTFVRTAGINLGKFELKDSQLDDATSDRLKSVVKEYKVQQVHAWGREIGSTDDQTLRQFIQGDIPDAHQPLCQFAENQRLGFNQLARNDQTVLNIVDLGKNSYWYSVHRVESPQQRWPGGVFRFQAPSETISRAYFKTKEAILWSRFPIQKNDIAIEIGCAPGGSVLALLENGLKVIGIDPANMHESVLSHPDFIHLKKRGSEVRKKQLAAAKWLLADSNVAPQYTLDMVDEITSNQHVNIKGLLLTYKLLQPGLVEQIGPFCERLHSMGFQYVRTRQLAFNRNEICVAALRRKSLLRFGKRKRTRSTETAVIEDNNPNVPSDPETPTESP